VTPDPNLLLREAEGHFVARRFAAARPLVEQVLRIVPGHPAVLHLHGLILSGLSDQTGARRALESAHRAAPRDARIANDLGNLLGRIGDPAAALAAYDAATRADPGFATARLHRAMMLDELGRYDEARAEFAVLARIATPTADMLVAAASVERNSGDLAAAAVRLDAALALEPGHAMARHGRARIAADMGEAGASARYRDALADAPADRDLLLGYIAAAENQEERADALTRIAATVARDPDWHEGRRTLATARWEDGASDAFTATYEPALASQPRNAGLWQDYVSVLGKADDFAAAARAALRAEQATGSANFAAAAFGYLSASGAVGEADALLGRLPAGLLPAVSVAKHRLRTGDPATAERLLAAETDAGPNDIEAWALRGIAWALLDDPRFDWLNGQEGLVRVHELPLSDDEMAAVVGLLRTLHARSSLRLGQSVRGGTQTHGNLLDRGEPEIALLGRAIRDAVERHRAALPPFDASHPILRHRDAPLAIAGSWSIRLTGGGFHVQHMHPKGILSAASYWVVPEAPADDGHAGWLEIGGAPAYLGIDLSPLRRIEPRPGRLVLFPSTLHHGTRPFPAGERMTVAFDVIAR
jgi:tetratricopeptide (TPR) repeat protein